MSYSVVVVAVDYLFITIRQTLAIFLVNMEENTFLNFIIFGIFFKKKDMNLKKPYGLDIK